MPLQLSDEDKAEMEDTIGNLPILLIALLEIKLDDLEDAETEDAAEEESYARKLSQLYDKLWRSPQVKMMSSTILVYAERQSEMLRHDKLLRYVHRFFDSVNYTLSS
jgi:hypothetical protein